MPVKMKIFIIALAVMCLMTCMCVTVFAADAPPGDVIKNGVEFVVTNGSPADIQLFLYAQPGVTYTITGLGGYARLYGWTGSAWTLVKTYDMKTEWSFTPSVDYPEYEYFAWDAGQDGIVATVTWEEPTLWGQAGTFVTGVMDNFGGPVLSFISSHALVLIPALAGLCILGILVVRRFVYGA